MVPKALASDSGGAMSGLELETPGALQLLRNDTQYPCVATILPDRSPDMVPMVAPPRKRREIDMGILCDPVNSPSVGVTSYSP